MRQVLSFIGGLEGIQEEFRPSELPVHILGRDVEMVQQLNETIHPHPLESLVTDELDRTYNKPPQPRGERCQVAKTNKVLCTGA